MRVAAVLVAAGAGERLGAGLPKALVSLRDRTILDWSVRAFAAHPQVDSLVVVAPAAAVDAVATAMPAGTTVVPGGTSRQQSVRRGLAAIGEDIEFVLVHDAARPLVPEAVISAVIAALAGGADAVIPVLPVIDTIKRVTEDGLVRNGVDRTDLRRVQTPQGFRLALLRAAHEADPPAEPGPITDDAGLLEALGVAVATVPGDEAAFKITTSHELLLAELLLAR
ncbi:MAG: 2-C-methyl-D-erythritol 4-phosphate cytidylyltransferase [Jatrophihabitans sp.]